MLKEVEEKGGKGNGAGCSLRKGVCAGAFVLRLLSLSGRNLRGGLRGGSQQNIHQFSRCALSKAWSPLVSTGAGGHYHCSWSRCRPPGFAAFLGLELQYG